MMHTLHYIHTYIRTYKDQIHTKRTVKITINSGCKVVQNHLPDVVRSISRLYFATHCYKFIAIERCLKYDVGIGIFFVLAAAVGFLVFSPRKAFYLLLYVFF